MKYSKEFKAGLIVLITLVSFWFFFQYLKGNDVFSSGNVYYADYENVDGLLPTKAVTLNGLKVGKVVSISPKINENGKYTFRVKFIVDEEYPFNKDSKIEIYKPDFLGGKEIRIVLSETPPLAKDGDLLNGTINASITDVLSEEVTPLKNNLNSVLNELNATLKQSQKLLDDESIAQLKNTVISLQTTLGSFKETSTSANNLINSNQKKIGSLLDNSNQLMGTSEKTVAKYGDLATKLNDLDLQKTLENLNQSTSKINSLLSDMNQGKGTLGKLTKDEELYNNLVKTTSELNNLMSDLKENPKKYINISVFGKKDKL